MGTVGASPARRRTLELNHFVKPATCCRFERLKPGNVAMSFADHSVVFSRDPPFESGTVPVGGTVAGTTYSYILAVILCDVMMPEWKPVAPRQCRLWNF